MEELVKLVSERTGLPPETAKLAVETVLGYVKDRLPGPIASQLEGVMGTAGSSGGTDDLLGGLGRFLGR